MNNAIIGDGDIASVLHRVTPKGLTFFASGVSNSQELRESEYDREKKLLLSQPKDGHIVYFSSLCVYTATSRYAGHKREMELLVKHYFPRNTVVRLGNITWGDNPNTVINHFRRKITLNLPIEILEGYRYLITEDELIYWMNLIPDWNTELNITGRMIKINDIVGELKAGIL